MKRHFIAVLALAGLFSVPAGARAVDLSLLFSYQDPNGLVSGDFTLRATAVAGDPGAYLATAGTLDLTAPAADGIAGNYTLVANPDGPNARYSAKGLFIYDDLVMPGADPVVTNPGLLAFGGPGLGNMPEGKGSEINLFSNGPGSYSLYTGVNGSYPYSYVFTTPQGSIDAKSTTPLSAGTAELIVAPEPATWAILPSFLLIALSAARIRKRALE